MASNIRGITVEIGGNTTKLGKALEDTQKQTRGVQNELRQVERLLKFDPTNTELLIQKQNLLADAVLATSNKLDTLKEAEAQVIAQFERGEIGEEQLRAFQREIIQTEQTLNGLRDDLNVATRNLNEFGDNTGVAREEAARLEAELREQADALEQEERALREAEEAQREHEQAVADAREELSQFGDSAKDSLGKLGTGLAVLGGATIAMSGYALNFSTEFDKAFNTLVTQTGATTDEFNELDEAMTNVYANNFGESIEDVAESMALVKQNTKETGEALQETTEYALLMRDTFGFEVAESTRAAKMMMDQFGISSKDAYNLIAQGAQNGLNKNDDLLDTINEYSVHFQQLGIDAPTMFNMLASGAESGTFSVDKLGDAIKEFGIRTKDGSDASRDAFKYLGYDADEMFKVFNKGGQEAADMTQIIIDELAGMPDGVEKTTAGVALFGTMWEDLGSKGIKALSELDGEISLTKDSLDQINKQKYDDIGSALQGLKRTLETSVVEPLGEELKPVVEDVISYVDENGDEIADVLSNIVEKIGEFVGFIVDNGSTIIAMIAGIGTGLLVWNVAQMIMGLVGAIKAFMLATEGATLAMKIFNAVGKANVFILIASVIATVIVAIVTFLATNEDARKKLVEIWNKIKEVASTVFGAIATFFTETVPNAVSTFVSKVKGFFTTVINFVKDNWKQILLFIVSPFAGAFALLYKNCDGFRNFVNNFVEAIKNFFVNAWNGIVNFFTQTIPNLITNIVNWFNSLPEKIGYAIGFVLGKLILWASNIIKWIKTNVPKIINNIITFFKELPGKIWTFLVNVVTKIVTWGANMKEKATSAVKKLISSVVTFFKELPSKIWSAIVGAVSKIATWGSNMKEKATSAIKNLVSSVVSTAQSLPGKIYNAIVGAISKISSWGSQMLSKAKSAIKNVASAITDGLKSIPSKLGSIGKNIVEGLWNGIKNATGWIKDKVGGFAKGILKGMKDALKIKSPSQTFRDQVGRYIAEGVGVGITENEDSALNAVDQLSEDMINQAQKINGVTLKRQLETTFNGSVSQDASILDRLDTIVKKLETKTQIFLDGDKLVGETVDRMDVALANNQILRARGV